MVHLLEWLLSKRQKISIREHLKKREPWHIVDGNIIWHSHYETSMEVPQKIKNRTQQSYYWIIYLKDMKPIFQRDVCICMLIVALFTTTKMWTAYQ
jgi:hypothetical protein